MPTWIHANQRLTHCTNSKRNLTRYLGSPAGFGDNTEFICHDVSSHEPFPCAVSFWLCHFFSAFGVCLRLTLMADFVDKQSQSIDAAVLDVMEPWAGHTLYNICDVLRPGGRLVALCK